jgi:hypothetical protein
MAMYDVYLEPTYSAIHIIFENAPGANEMEFFLNNLTQGFFVASPPFPDDPLDNKFAKPLLFVLTTTSTTPKHIFTITPADIGLVTFPDGLYHFKFDNVEYGINGVIVDREIKCCIAKKLAEYDGCGSGCDDAAITKEINEVHAFLVSADAAIRSGNPNVAMCGMIAIDSLCENCGCGE